MRKQHEERMKDTEKRRFLKYDLEGHSSSTTAGVLKQTTKGPKETRLSGRKKIKPLII